MPLGTQAKLLRVIQESLFEHVGGTRPIKVNIRFIAATNQELASMCDKGLFRQDLYFRLNVFPITLPRLRDRKEDIPLLIDRFLEKSNKNQTIAPETLQLLTAYDWPGNVRELQNAIESAQVLASDTIFPTHLPQTLTQSFGNLEQQTQEATATAGEMNIDSRMQQLEKGMIVEALKRANGIQSQTAKLLGIKERSLWHRIKKYEIDVSVYKINGDSD